MGRGVKAFGGVQGVLRLGQMLPGNRLKIIERDHKLAVGLKNGNGRKSVPGK